MFEAAWNIIWILHVLQTFSKVKIVEFLAHIFHDFPKTLIQHFHPTSRSDWSGVQGQKCKQGLCRVSITFTACKCSAINPFQERSSESLWLCLPLSLSPVSLLRKRNRPSFIVVDTKCWTLWGEQRSWSPGFIKPSSALKPVYCVFCRKRNRLE